MSSLKQTQTETEFLDLSEDAIADYLLAHPDFFERHGKLLGNLRLPHKIGGPAVSLVEKQVAVLRQRNLQLERKLRDLVEVAKGNDQLAEKIHSLALELLDTDSPAETVDRLEEQLRVSFKADRSVLVLFRSLDGVMDNQFFRPLDRDAESLAPFNTFLESNAPRCGAVRDAQRSFLFGDHDVEIGSVALLPLGKSAELGFLAIGSRDANHFHPGKSMEFLVRLGELVTYALRH